jgi:peptidoglycan/LPS O-acetylase OafA/YrhL
VHRLSRLDGLRGVLAVYILIGHAMLFADVPAWLAGLFHHGEAMVDLFFALSGMVVVNSLERFDYRAAPFLLARGRRLLPVYFAVLALAVLIVCLGSPLGAMPWLPRQSIAGSFWAWYPPVSYAWQVLAHVFLIHGMIPAGVAPWIWISVLAPAWSLSTEWQFYIFMALVMPRLRARKLTHFALLMLALGVLYHATAPFLPAFWQFSRAFLPDAAPFFALGLASAVWMRGGTPIVFVFCLVAVCALGLFSHAPAKALTPLFWAVVLLAQRHPRMILLPALLDHPVAQYLGAISYPLYLVNMPIQRACAMAVLPFAHHDPVLFTTLWLPWALLLPIPAAIALHVWVEAPGLHWRGMAASLTPLLPLPQRRRIFTR